MSAQDRNDPSRLRLRPDLPKVMRLSRRSLLALATIAAALLGLVTAWSLTPRPHGAAPREVPPSDPPPAMELANLPKDYAALPPGVPKLGPPLPGDLGRAILEGANAGRSPRPEPPRLKALPGRGPGEPERTASSGLFPARSGVSDARPAVQPEVPASPKLAARAALGEPGLVGMSSSSALIPAGSVIPAVLITGLKSDLAGPVFAQVSEDVLDAQGRVAIPQGARLLGIYDAQSVSAQDRIMIRWTALRLDEDRSVSLANEPTADVEGFAGLQGAANHHWLSIGAAAATSTLLALGAEAGASASQSPLEEALRRGLASGSSQVGQALVGRSLEKKPSLTLPPGAELHVLLTHDLVLSGDSEWGRPTFSPPGDAAGPAARE